MKDLIVNKCITYISKNTDYDEVKLKEIKYGLGSIYLTFSKLIVILCLAFCLGIIKEVIIFSIFFNILRSPAFGLHATKTWICLISSIILFIGLPLLCIYLNINMYIKIILGCIGVLLMFKNAPADTKKRPIINKKRRIIYKTISTVLAIIFLFLCILINNNFISNCLLFALILEICLISPFVYKIFRLPYNNYITYLEEHPEFLNN